MALAVMDAYMHDFYTQIFARGRPIISMCSISFRIRDYKVEAHMMEKV